MSIQIESFPTPFAYLLDQPGMIAVLTYEFPVPNTPYDAYMKWIDQSLPKYSVIHWEEPLVLPFLTNDAAEEAALHSFYSGAPLRVCAAVAAQRGMDALHDYADTQSMYGMPGAPELDDDALHFFGSGL